MILPVISSVLGIIAFNANFYPLIFLALVPLFLFFLREDNFWKLIIGAVLFRLIFAFGTVYFVLDPFLYGLSILIFIGLPVSVYLVKKFLPDYVVYFLLPVLWVFWDYLESQYTLLPMTIVVFGNALANSPFLGLARYGGVIGLAMFTAVVNIIFTVAVNFRKSGFYLIFWIAVAAFFLIIGFIFSKILIHKNAEDYALKNRIARVALMSVSDEENNFDGAFSVFILPENTDLLIMPEDLYPHDIKNYQEAINAYSGIAKNSKVAVSAATTRFDQSNGRGNLYKSSLVFSKNGEIVGIYDKVNRTITSEYWPFDNWRPFYFDFYLKQLTNLEEKNRAIFDSEYQYQKGKEGLLKTGGFSFASLICIEGHYPFYVKKLADMGADFISFNSNNKWIKQGIGQYLRLSNDLRKIEAVWLNKPILINGIMDYAGVILPDGTLDLKAAANGRIIFETEIRY